MVRYHKLRAQAGAKEEEGGGGEFQFVFSLFVNEKHEIMFETLFWKRGGGDNVCFNLKFGKWDNVCFNLNLGKPTPKIIVQKFHSFFFQVEVARGT